MKEDKPKRETFQTMIKVEMFGMRFIIINNWYIGILALCSLSGNIDAQEREMRNKNLLERKSMKPEVFKGK